MKKCIGIYLRLSQEDVDKKTNRAKDESNSIAAQRQLIKRHIEQNPYLSSLPQMRRGGKIKKAKIFPLLIYYWKNKKNHIQ